MPPCGHRCVARSRRRTSCNVKFIIEGEEETGSVHLPAFIPGAQGFVSGRCLPLGIWRRKCGWCAVQYAGMRGICYVELSVETASRDSHSGLTGSIFQNAAWRLIWALRSLKGTDELIRLPGFYDRVISPSDRDLELLAALPDPTAYYHEHYGIDGYLKNVGGGLELRKEMVFVPTCTVCGLTAGYQGEGSKNRAACSCQRQSGLPPGAGSAA